MTIRTEQEHLVTYKCAQNLVVTIIEQLLKTI